MESLKPPRVLPGQRPVSGAALLIGHGTGRSTRCDCSVLVYRMFNQMEIGRIHREAKASEIHAQPHYVKNIISLTVSL